MAYLGVIDEERPGVGAEEDVDCDRLDSEEGIGLKTLETLEGAKPTPVDVLVVVGMTGCGVVCEVLVGGEGTVGWLTKDFSEEDC